MGRKNQVLWRYAQPTDPAVPFPVSSSDPVFFSSGSWFWNGSIWVKGKCDSDGHIQSDVLSLPTPVLVSQDTPSNLKATVTQASDVRQIYPQRKSSTTQIIANTRPTNGTEVLYAVPTGKTFFLTSASIMAYACAAGTFYMTIRDGADNILYYIFMLLSTSTSAPSLAHFFLPPIEIPASFDIALTSTVPGLSINGFLTGWIE